MAEPILFDARIEELLREVAADPQSSLLRVPRPARLGVVLGRRPAVGVATAGLSAAERELVAVHRGELSYLLRKLAVVRLFESPAAATSRVRTCFIGAPRLATDRREWVDDARIKLEGALADEPADPGRELLERCVREPETIGSLHVTDIAAAANLLDPTDQARIYAGIWLGNELHSQKQACDVLMSVIDGPCSPENRSAAAANLGRVASLFDDPRSACRWYRISSEGALSSATAVLSWLTTALDCADGEEVRVSAERIEHQFTCEDPALQEFLALLAAQRRSTGPLLRDTDSWRLANRISNSANAALGSILHAYLSS